MSSRPAPPRGRVLVLDDAEPILVPMKAYLETAGWTVDCVRDVEKAQALLSEGGYDIAVIELSPAEGAPGVDLVDLAIRSSPSTRLIVLTAHGSAELERELRRKGVDTYLQKPTSLSALALQMTRLVERPAVGDGTAIGSTR